MKETKDIYEVMRANSQELRDCTPIKLTVRRDIKANELLIVYQDTYSYDPSVKVCYSHVGQHSSIHKDYYRQCTKAVTREEARPILEELVYNYPKNNLQLVSRIYWNK